MELVNLKKERKERSNKYDIKHDGETFKLDIEACSWGYFILYFIEHEIPIEQLPPWVPKEAAKQKQTIYRKHIELRFYEKPFITLDAKVKKEILKAKEKVEGDFRKLDAEKKLKEEIGI